MSHSILYVIRSTTHELHKIGVTNNWNRRQQELEVGIKAEPVHVVRINNANSLEKYLHRRFKNKRLPQSEWFNLDDYELDFVRSAVLKAKNDYSRASGEQSAPPRPKPVAAPEPPRQPSTPQPPSRALVFLGRVLMGAAFAMALTAAAFVASLLSALVSLLGPALPAVVVMGALVIAQARSNKPRPLP